MNTAISYRLLTVIMAVSVMTTLGAPRLTGQESTDNDTQLPPPQGSYHILADDGVVTFPFEIFRGDIRFDAEINGHPVKLLLDDGFMWDPILFWGSPRIDSLGLVFDGETSIGGGTEDENQVPARTASGITVRFPGVEIVDQTALITAYDSDVANMWWGSEGQVSCTLLRHFVVDINFDNMMITLIEPDKFEYDGDGVAIPWEPMGFGPMSIPATLGLSDGRAVTVDLLMDLGYNDQLQITTVGEHHIKPPANALPAGLGSNIQGVETLGHVGRLPSVSIGGYEIEGVIGAFVAEEYCADKYSEVMIGLGLLSRFNLTFDCNRQRLYVEPNKTFGNPYEHNMSGLSTRRGQGDYREVTAILPGSPAEEAGLKVGDQITAINGRPATDYDYFELEPLLEREGTTLIVTVARGDASVELPIRLRRLL